jgi:hypothetical protein
MTAPGDPPVAGPGAPPTTAPVAGAAADPVGQVREARRVKAYDFAADAGKQVLLLSTGVLTVTATFAKDLIGRENLHGILGALLVAAWVLFLLSIVCGLWFLYALVGSLGQRHPDDDPPSVYDTNATLPSLLQTGTFLLAMACTVIVGAVGLT